MQVKTKRYSTRYWRLILSAAVLLTLSPAFVSAQSVTVNGYGKGGKPKPSPTPTPEPRDPFWDVSAGAGNGTGGSATWTNQTDLLWSTTAAGDATLVAAGPADPGVFQGTAGTVTIAGNLSLGSWTFNTTNYVLTPSSGAARTLTGPFSLATGINLNIGAAAKTTDTTFNIVGSFTGGAGSSLTLQGNQTGSGSNVRLVMKQASSSIDVPIVVSGTGTTFAGVVSDATGVTLTGTITNNSSFTTLLGATAGNDLTLSSAAVISGTAGLRIGVTNGTNNAGTVTLNAANTYGGNTTLDGGTLVLGDNNALSSGLLTVTAASTIAAGGGSRTIANAVTLGGNTTIASGNDLTINGTLTGSGSATRTLTVNNNTTLGGNVFLSESNGNSRTLEIAGSGALTINSVITNNSGLNTLGSNLQLNSATVTLTLNGTNTYSGATTLSAGTLVLGNKSAFGTSTVAWNGVSTSASTDLSGVNAITNIGTLGGDNTFTGTNNLELSGTLTATGGNRITTNNISGGTLTLSGTVNLSNNTNNRTQTFAGTGNTLISGLISNGASSASNLVKAGTGALTLTGANTYTGTTTISAGILQLGDGGTTGSLSTSSTITDNGNFTINQSDSVAQGTDFSGAPITGTGSLTQAGSGTLTLNAANTYSGGTILSAGTLQLGSSSTGAVTNGPVGTGTLTLNGGTLSSNVGDFITVRSIANAVTFGGDVTFGTNTNFGALNLSGAGTLTGNRTLTFVADVTYSGNIGESGGSFGITKNGSGTLKLSGVNGYSGGTTVNAGLLWLNSSSALGSTSGSLTVNGGIVDLAGNNISVGNLTGTGGTIWNNLGPLNNAVTLTIGTGNAGGGNYQGVIANTNGASGASTLALTKVGTGTITLSGTNTYSGATTINGGTLLINGSTAAGSAVTVNNTGTLGGTGTVSGTVDVKSGGTLSPGTSPGTLTTGALTLENGSTFAVDLTASLGNDLVVAPSLTLGTIVIGPSLSLNITGSLSIGQQFFIVDNTGGSAVSGVFAQGAIVTSGSYTFLIDYVANYDTLSPVGGNDIMLEVTAVPEPGTWVAALLAAAVIGYSLSVNRNRKKRSLARA